MRKVTVGICSSSRTNCMFHMLQEVGAKRKVYVEVRLKLDTLTHNVITS